MKFIIFISVLLFCFSSFAFTVEQKIADPVLEKRAQKIFEDVRCVVCAGQSIADSDVELASDLRTLIRKKIESGASDKEIAQYLVDRYGEEILFLPPFKPSTIFLWFGPFLILFGGFMAVFLNSKNKRKNS